MIFIRHHLRNASLILNAYLLCTFGFFPTESVAEQSSIQLQIDKRITREEALDLDTYSAKPAQTLKQEMQKQKQESSERQARPLEIDVKKALVPDDELGQLKLENIGTSKESGSQLTLAEVRTQALKNNLSLKVLAFDPVIAQNIVREEEAKFDNIIFAYAKYAEKDLPAYSGDKVEFKSDNPALDAEKLKLSILEQQKQESMIEAGIKVPLRTGGTVTLSSPLSKKVSKGQLSSREYQNALRFSFSQPLLRDVGVRVNEASIQIAAYEQQAIQLRTRLQSIRVVAMVDKAYWDLYQAWGELDVRRQQFEYASQNLDMVKKRVDEGLTAAIELNRAEIGVADRMEALIVSETNLKLAQRQLQFLLNDINSQSAEPIIPVTSPKLLKFEFNRAKLLEDAMQGRLELLEQEIKLTADLTKIDYLENQTLPLFTLDYQYGALSNTFNSMGDTYRGVLNGDYSDWSIGLKFEMPLTNEARKARLDNAIQQRMQRLTTKQLQELTVKKEIYDALDKVDQNWQRIVIARQQVLIAGLNYEAELKQFGEGLRTMTEVLETLTRLGEAQVKEVRAISDYQISLIDMAYATGTLLGYSKVQFQ